MTGAIDPGDHRWVKHVDLIAADDWVVSSNHNVYRSLDVAHCDRGLAVPRIGLIVLISHERPHHGLAAAFLCSITDEVCNGCECNNTVDPKIPVLRGPECEMSSRGVADENRANPGGRFYEVHCGRYILETTGPATAFVTDASILRYPHVISVARQRLSHGKRVLVRVGI